MNLVLVESPAKAKTIEKYLGKEYKVKATVGHLIDLPKSKLSVDVENDYKPDFVVMEGKNKIINEIKKLLPKKGSPGEVFLAMDPDREGEAIAFHTAQALKLKDPKRVSFHEITKTAVTNAIAQPRKIDMDLVDAQFARRVLDRLVGYKVSEVIWKKIRYGLSAGRVQSVALKLIVEREKEIKAFKPEEFWEIYVDLKDHADKEIKAKLVKINGKKANLKNALDVESIEKDLMHKPYDVREIDVKDKTLHAYPPFTTSTLQQAGNNLLGLGAKRTMGIAQALYQQGFITYMRTDSVNLSEDAIAQFRGYISHSKNLGDAYLPETPNYYKNKSRNAQEAHEAIRPTDITKTSAELGLGAQDAKLYDLIWKRALASQMNSYRAKVFTAHIIPDGDNKYDFVVVAQKTIFEGFKKIWDFKSLDELGIQEISDMKQGDHLKYVNLDKQQKFTKPKARYTEATLVKALESLGVGRPSTYATIISTIQDRGYVEKMDRKLVPTDTGFVVDKFLEENFNRLVDYQYTAKVEERLDDISEGKLKYVPFMDEEYKPLVKELKLANENADKESYVVLGESDEKCPECGSKMVIKLGKYGKFLSCSKFPECKGMKSLVDETINFDKEKYITPDKCPKCGNKLMLKNGRYGIYWACEKYPDCKGALPLMLKQVCPDCGKNLVERKSRWGKSFIGCSGYPDCTYIQKADGTRAVTRKFKAKKRAGKGNTRGTRTKASKAKAAGKTTKKRATKSKATKAKK